MADESTIRAVLTAYAGFTSLIGGAVTPRLWDQVVPPSEPSPATRPFVTMTTVSDVPEGALDSAPGIAALRIQFDIYADTKASAKGVLTQLRAALTGAGYYDSEQLTHDMPSGDATLKRISSDWQFFLPR